MDQSDSKTVIENVMSQKGEIGLTGYKMHNSLVYEPVFMDELVLIVPDTERYARWKMGSTVSFRDFEHETFILREEGSGTKQEMEKAEIHGVPVFKNVDVIARMNSTETIKQAVAGGLGISILSRMAAGEKEETHRIKYLKIDGLDKKRTFYMVYSKNIRLSPIAEAFRDLVIDYRDRNWQQDYVRVYVRVHARFSVRIYAGLSCMEFCIENVYSKKTCYVFLNWICSFHFGKMKVVLPKEKGI